MMSEGRIFSKYFVSGIEGGSVPPGQSLQTHCEVKFIVGILTTAS